MRNIASIDLFHVNCTDTNYIECQIAFWLWRTVPFALLTIGLLGNILNFVVLSRQRLRKHSTSVYLLFLAGSDTIFLLFGPLPDTIHAVADYRLWDKSVLFCKTRCWIIHTSAAFSVWLLVSLTIERFLITKGQICTRARLTPKISLVVSMVTLLLISIGNSHCFIGYKHYASQEEVEEEFGSKLLHFPCNFASKEYMIFHQEVWGIIILILFNIVPIIFILIGNVNIAAAIVFQKKRLHTVHPVWQTNVTQRSEGPKPLNNQTNRDISLRVLSREPKERKDNVQTTNIASPQAKLSVINNRNRYIFQQRNQPHSTIDIQSTRPSTIKTKNYFSTARMLFTLTIFFIVTTSPYCLYAVLKGRLEELSDKDVAKWQLITVAVLIFAWSNYAFNFFLYFMSGTLFKQEWKRLLKKGKLKCNQMRYM